ncbi:MAG: glycosyltransferase family 8 protein [Selenomonadaceae bacterium]|nr:glycosyltransferase family 8 protein [Selenomonadaceae bacterium]
MIHVCFGIYDKDGRYSKFAGTTIASIFENTTSEVTVNILHDSTMTMNNFQNFVYLAGKYGQKVKFYNVEKICADKINEIKEKFPQVTTHRVTIGTMYRLLAADIFPVSVKKIIYLDSDMIVNLDINDLWKIELGDKVIASVPESQADTTFFERVSRVHHLINSEMVKYEDYFNVAVMSINLDKLREDRQILQRGMEFVFNTPECVAHDQDILNYCFANDYVHLPNRFDRFVTSERVERQPVRNVIYHFTGPNPSMNFRDPLNRLYFQYFAKTPWFNADTFGRLYDGVRQIQHECQSRAMGLSKMMSGKRRAFFTSQTNVNVVKKAFGVEDGEELILNVDDKAIHKLIDSMKKSHGRKLYFIVTGSFSFFREELEKAGFVDGKDFVNGTVFLSEIQGVPMNSYPLVKAM